METGKKKQTAGKRLWQGVIIGLIICLAVELVSLAGIPVTKPIEWAAERLAKAVPQEKAEQWQDMISGLTSGWMADSLPVCGYCSAMAANADSGGISDYTAALWIALNEDPALKHAAALDRAAGGTVLGGQGTESGAEANGEESGAQGNGEEPGNECGDEGSETEKSGEEGENGAGENVSSENNSEAENDGSGTAGDGEGASGSGGEEAERKLSEQTENSDETTAGQENEEGDDTTETVANTFLMPSITGKLYTAEMLTYSFLTSDFYNISAATVVYESELNGSLLSVPLTLSEITEEPQILIYHTHSHEFFVDSDTSDLSTGIVGVGSYLTELLESYGYSVLHLTDQFDYVDGVLDRSKAYTRAGVRLKEVLAEYPSIEVMIDLHRDGVDDDLHLVTEINGKSTAMIMFFNGMSRTTSGNISYLSNANLEANLAFSLQLKVKAEAYYPGFTRKNYIKPYRYNLHLLEKSLLIEAGAQTNTFEEVKNAMEPLAALLHIQLSGLDSCY